MCRSNLTELHKTLCELLEIFQESPKFEDLELVNSDMSGRTLSSIVYRNHFSEAICASGNVAKASSRDVVDSVHVGRLNPLTERIQCTLKHPGAANISENERIKVSLKGRNSTTSRGELVEFVWRRSWENIFLKYKKEMRPE